MIETAEARVERIRAALSLLTPYDIVGASKKRVGRTMDGGYVLVEEANPPDVLYSFGVGQEISFEYELAQRGCKAYLFDHTVDRLPYQHPNLHFSKEGIGATVHPTEPIASLDHYVARNGDAERTDMLLKIDVEGSEYETLVAADPTTLACFRQIALEVHCLHQLGDPSFCSLFSKAFSKLNELFTLCHVHANNCVPLRSIDGFPTADVLELTYVRTDLVARRESTTRYPTDLDYPNDPGRDDIPLGFYPFSPSGPQDQVPAAARPISAGEGPVDPPAQGSYDDLIVPQDQRRNILYLACHETLEYDDIRMFTAMGHRVFSVGGFSNPDAFKPATRPFMDRFYSREWWEAFAADPGCDQAQKRVSRDFVDRFDVVIVNHVAGLLDLNHDALVGKPVIFRSIGQSNKHIEATLSRHLDSVHVVRYSTKEVGLPHFCPSETVIYFGKFLDDYPQWVRGSRIVTFHNSFPTRSTTSVPTLTQYEEMARSGHLDLYGFKNDGIGAWRGLARAETQIALFRQAALYLYVYSLSASYTLSFIEAMLVGVPIIAPSASAVQEAVGPVADFLEFSPARYEIPDLLDHDPMLIWDRFEEIPSKIAAVMLNPGQSRQVSQRLRAKAASMFDVRIVAPQWHKLFTELV